MRLIKGDIAVGGEPMDRMTRLTAAMTDALEAHPEYSDDLRCMVVLSDDDTAGMSVLNYEDGRTAFADLIAQAQALSETIGFKLDLLMIPNDPGELT